MGTKLRVMNLEVDLLTEDLFQETMQEYLSNDYLNIVHIIPLDYVEEEKEEIHQVLEESDLVLPGEKTIFANHHVDVLDTGGMVVNYKSLFRIMGDIGLKGKKYYFIMRNKNEAKSFFRLIQMMKLGCECVGIYAEDSGVTEEALINDINTKVPDLIFLCLDRGEQEAWIAENKAKLNAKLCLCMGGILPLIRRDNPIVPRWVRFLHLEKPYRAILRIPTSHFFRKRIFQRKMADYNNKKQSKE